MKEKIKQQVQNILQKRKLLIGIIILIPIIIGIISFVIVSVKSHNTTQAGTYVYKDKSVVTYSKEGLKKLHALERNRQPILQSDELVREMLVKRKNPLAKTADYTVTYDPKTNMFQAQINTVSTDVAKKEVVAWFVSQGMSTQALCELPVSFTLSPATIQSLHGLDVVFYPLAPGC